MHTSHESIYRYVYVVARGKLQRELAKCLRRHHPTRKPHRQGVAATRGQIPDMVLVDERPAVLSKVSYQQLSAYQEIHNERPRKILEWKSPAQCFHELISSLLSN